MGKALSSKDNQTSPPDAGPQGRGYAVFCGLDVAKARHHACALSPDGVKLFDGTLGNDEEELTALFTQLAEHGRVLAVVDQPSSIGALSIAVARKVGIDVAYLPGLAMRRLSDLHPGQAKTDARDAFVIADAARTMPHTLRQAGGTDEDMTGLAVLVSYDQDLSAAETRLQQQIRDSMLHMHPALERLLGDRLQISGVLDLLAVAPTPAQLRALGLDGITAVIKARSPRMAKLLPAQIIAALDAQTVQIPATAQLGRTVAGRAAQLRSFREERAQIAADLEVILEAHPLSRVLTSMPGVGLRTATSILIVVGDGSAFPTAGHLASYAGLAPVTRRSGTSIRGESRSRRGNLALKRALYLSAFASLCDPDSRAYYDRKKAEGKRHTGALLCLARRRLDVMHAMIRNQTPYQPARTPTAPGTAAA